MSKQIKSLRDDLDALRADLVAMQHQLHDPRNEEQFFDGHPQRGDLVIEDQDVPVRVVDLAVGPGRPNTVPVGVRLPEFGTGTSDGLADDAAGLAGRLAHDDSSVVGDGAATPTDPTVEAARTLGADSGKEGAVDDSAAPSADMQSRLIHARGLVLSASGRLAETLAVLASALDNMDTSA